VLEQGVGVRGERMREGRAGVTGCGQLSKLRATTPSHTAAMVTRPTQTQHTEPKAPAHHHGHLPVHAEGDVGGQRGGLGEGGEVAQSKGERHGLRGGGGGGGGCNEG